MWLIPQGALVAINAWRWPLSAGLGAAPEALALEQLTILQILLCGLIFPALLRQWPVSGAALLGLWPLTLAAGFLAGRPWSQAVYCAVASSAMLIALIWPARAMRTWRGQVWGLLVVNSLLWGAALLIYARWEL